jgi:hypothetical protein
MMLELDLYAKDKTDCFSNAIASISQKWGKEYIMMFLDMWNLYYHECSSTNPTDKIRPFYKPNYSEHLAYHGIKISEKTISDFDSFLSEIKIKSSDNNIYIASLDAYYCHWYFGYNTYHRSHVCIVLDVDCGDIILLDTFYTFKAERIKITEFHKAIKFYYEVEQVNPILINGKEEYKSLLYNALIKQSNELSGMFISFEKTLMYLKDTNNIEKIYSDYPTIEANPLIYIFKTFQFYRKSFSKCLEYIESKSGIELKKYTNELFAICDIWENIRLILAKINLKYTEKSHQALLQQFTVVMELEQSLHGKLLAEISYRK